MKTKDTTPDWQSCESLLDTVGVPAPFTIDAMIGIVENHIGGRINVREVKLDVRAPCGLWLAIGNVNYVFVDARSLLHRNHVVLHELAHMIYRHGTSHSDLADLLPDIDPARIKAALARTGYGDRQEAEAELMATIIARRVGRHTEPMSDFEYNLR